MDEDEEEKDIDHEVEEIRSHASLPDGILRPVDINTVSWLSSSFLHFAILYCGVTVLCASIVVSNFLPLHVAL